MNKVWILTSEYNDYDQHGEYLEQVFFKYPSEEDIYKFLCTNNEINSEMYKQFINDFIYHILNGGGRRGYEECWYYLREYSDSKC